MEHSPTSATGTGWERTPSSFRWHQDPNPFTFKELGELGYKFIFITLFASNAATYATWNPMEELVP